MRAPSLYKHFPDKAHLEAALIEDIFFAIGDVLHEALADPGRRRRGRAASWPPTARTRSPTRTATGSPPAAGSAATSSPSASRSGPASRSSSRAGDPFRSQALWSFAHGMVILEIDGRYPDGSDLDRTWEAGAAAFAPDGRGGPGQGASSATASGTPETDGNDAADP